MPSTYASYQLIARDVPKSLARVEKQTAVQRDTAYFEKNIGKVKTVDEFMKDSRLYTYAMKAYGLEDMIYAKAFMKKALEGGVSDANSFANKLTDKRYAEFVRAFNFAARSERATNYAPAQQGVSDRYTVEAIKAGLAADDPALVKQNKDYEAAVATVTTIDGFLNNDAVYAYAMKAFGLSTETNSKDFMRSILQGGVADPKSLANTQKDTVYAEFAATFDFAGKGAEATTFRAAVDGTEAKFMRQKLEEDAGAQNEGVRLALNFERKASAITSWYDVLADKALASVVRTAFSLPDSIAQADVDKQVALFKQKFDIEDFADKAALGKFLKRFTALWDAKTQTADASPAVQLFQGPNYGISTSLALTMQQLKF
jgi:hypothetical protein